MNESKLRALARAAAALCLAFVATACQGGNGQPARVAPSRTIAVLACMMGTSRTATNTSAVLDVCARQVPKIVATGFDQGTIDGVLAGNAAAADPGIRGACFRGDSTRAIAGIETMGYGVVMDGLSEQVVIVRQDDVTTYHRDGTVESARVSGNVVSSPDTAAPSGSRPSACTMMIAHALTVASICADLQWTGAGCVALRAKVLRCGNPPRLMVDPDVGFDCQPTVDAAAIARAATRACAEKGGAAGACAPEVSLNGWLSDPGGICASPRASVSADNETCVVPIGVSGPRSAADITAVILWGRTTSGGPVFTAEPAKPRG